MHRQQGPLIPRTMVTCLVVVAAFGSPARAAHSPNPETAVPRNPAFAPIEDDPALPRVLLLGDSISIGYTESVRELLKGKANVHRAMENCGPTTRGLERLDAWLGDAPWDVIHFNFGLHDLKEVKGAGDPDSEAALRRIQVQVPSDRYEANLHCLVERLRATGATLIWCTTTPVPEGAVRRRPGDAAKYDAVAARVMRRTLGEERIINDLYALARPQIATIQIPADVHFTPVGSRRLGDQVARVIEQHLPRPRSAEVETATGVVYHDTNGNGSRDPEDRPLPAVRVSNGHEIVRTDLEGLYRLPVDDDTILFVIKPRGWRVPMSPEMLPRFYYVHKPNGSPSQAYAGVAATGPLPESVDFPLTPQEEPALFKAILFGDPQPRDQREVDFIAHDVIEELVGTDASFGVTLGDIAFDNLDVFEAQARAIAVLGIPWHNVIGNHDLNYDARRDRDSDETFERVFGPSYYSFDYGPVHFIVLDDVEWLVDEKGKSRYQGGLGKRQVAFVRRDLELTDPRQLVVLMMHIPLTQVRDRHDLFHLIEERPFCMSVSAHQHVHEHRFITRADGWRGPKPHHHVIHVTVSGSWWSGMRDERGIPHTLMADGAPNGYSIITFDGHEYKMGMKAAGRSTNYQMAIHVPEAVMAREVGRTEVVVNVFNGSERSSVEMTVDGETWRAMTRTLRRDPAFRRVAERETLIRDGLADHGTDVDRIVRKLPKAAPSTHLWRAALPADLRPGTHRIDVRTTDMHGTTHTGHRIVRVTAD